MAVGMLASQQSYRDHLRPVWEALEPEERGIWADSLNGLGQVSTWMSASQRDFVSLRRTGANRIHMEHGVGLQWYPHRQLQQFLGCAAIAAPNEYIGQRFRDVKKRLRVEVIGTPKLDAMVGMEHGSAAAVSIHWSGVMRQRPTSFDLWRDTIIELAEHREVLGHAHPKVWSKAKRFYEEIGIEPVPAFEEVARRADLYLCDHSSTLYEWAALDRELVLLRRDGHEIPQLSGLAERYSGIGPELKLGGSLLAALEAAADPRFRTVRQEATEALYPYLGSATHRAVNLLREVEEEAR